MNALKVVFYFFFATGFGPEAFAIEWSEFESNAYLRHSAYVQPFTDMPDRDWIGSISTRSSISEGIVEVEFHPEVRSLNGSVSAAFQELFLRARTETVSVKAGLIKENWSVTDGFSALDIWSRADKRDPLRPEKLPYGMIKLTNTPQSGSFPIVDLVIVPNYESSRYPVKLPEKDGELRTLDLRESRWLTALPTQMGTATGIETPLRYEIEGSTVPPVFQFGARARWIDIEGMDVTLLHGRTVSSDPVFDVTARGSTSSPDLPVVARLKPVFSILHTYGLGVETTWEELGLRAELARVFQSTFREKEATSRIDGEFLPREKTTLAIGASRESGLRLSVFDIICGSTFTRTFQSATRSLVRDPWAQTLLLFVEGKSPTGSGVGLKTIKSLETGGTLIQPSISKSLENGLGVALSADFLEGPSDDLWGLFTDNDRYSFEVSYLF